MLSAIQLQPYCITYELPCTKLKSYVNTMLTIPVNHSHTITLECQQ